MNNELLTNLDRLHTTQLGVQRIRNNLSLDIPDVITWCKQNIEHSNTIIRKGKNWYVHIDNFVLTINAHSFTII
ncbi:MAG: hypothetical protein K0R34_4130, partial [Herbinix sp.]|nr:hypothetical protein [Herbinix sp.]